WSRRFSDCRPAGCPGCSGNITTRNERYEAQQSNERRPVRSNRMSGGLFSNEQRPVQGTNLKTKPSEVRKHRVIVGMFKGFPYTSTSDRKDRYKRQRIPGVEWCIYRQDAVFGGGRLAHQMHSF